jgi:large subunit ribosomal protein L9
LRVILRSEVRGVGRPGEVKDVADGYATNFLIPRGLAIRATPSALRAADQRQGSLAARAERERAEMRQLADRLSAQRLSFTLKAGAQGKVFGSVTNRDLVEALAARGVEIDRAKIVLAEPLKALGTHRVEVRLLPDVRVDLIVEIAGS